MTFGVFSCLHTMALTCGCVWSTGALEIRGHGKTHSKGHGMANLSFPAHTRPIGVTCTHIQEAQ